MFRRTTGRVQVGQMQQEVPLPADPINQVKVTRESRHGRNIEQIREDQEVTHKTLWTSYTG
jgi:hypothetical protein